jgi:hypothetical protein
MVLVGRMVLAGRMGEAVRSQAAAVRSRTEEAAHRMQAAAFRIQAEDTNLAAEESEGPGESTRRPAAVASQGLASSGRRSLLRLLRLPWRTPLMLGYLSTLFGEGG